MARKLFVCKLSMTVIICEDTDNVQLLSVRTQTMARQWPLIVCEDTDNGQTMAIYFQNFHSIKIAHLNFFRQIYITILS